MLPMKSNRFQQFAWGLLLYNLAVVYWGVYVRASFSGDGCGAHWPLCGGVAFPVNPQVKTVVELAHRLSSGLALLLVIVLGVWAFRKYPAGHGVRFGAAMSVMFTFSEALVGAALVLFRWVAHNPSVYRAVAVATHLTNTFVLLAALTLTAWCASNRKLPALRNQGFDGAALAVAAIAITILGITGTFAALGDSLYPSSSILAGMKQDFAPTAGYLLRLRPLHPFVAIIVSIYLGAIASIIAKRRPGREVKFFKRSLMSIFAFQLLFGFVNLMMHAPVWMQLEHLLIADILWINLVLFAAAALSVTVSISAETPARLSGEVIRKHA